MTAFFVLYRVLGPIVGAEDRPYVKRPEDTGIRMPVGSRFAHLKR